MSSNTDWELSKDHDQQQQQQGDSDMQYGPVVSDSDPTPAQGIERPKRVTLAEITDLARDLMAGQNSQEARDAAYRTLVNQLARMNDQNRDLSTQLEEAEAALNVLIDWMNHYVPADTRHEINEVLAEVAPSGKYHLAMTPWKYTVTLDIAQERKLVSPEEQMAQFEKAILDGLMAKGMSVAIQRIEGGL